MYDSDSSIVKLTLKHAELLFKSYAGLLHKNLLDWWTTPMSGEALAEALESAPFALLSHNGAADPIFTYGNRCALRLFEMTLDSFTKMPSRLSAEPENRAARQALLEAVSTNGYIDNYEGIRISATGKRFRIKAATVWNMVDDDLNVKGQAAMFNDWEYL